MIDLNECKRFAGIVGKDDDAVMQLCMESAVEYHKNAGVPDSAKESSQYRLSVYLLASHYFDNRSQIGEGQAASVPPSVVSCIAHLKYAPKDKGA
ncbi:MAG: phage gp6-like head-tail connector protein [Clostridia bacterium]|nr:phage gp6-like head-tail connector protein [Clostridia bacterium]